MDELKLEYYFKEIDNFRFKEVFDECTYPWDALTNIKSFLEKEVVGKDLKVNKAEVGEYCSIKGNYFIDEGNYS